MNGRIKTFYATYLDCENTESIQTIEMEMHPNASVEAAREYFNSPQFVGNRRIVLMSMHDADKIETMFLNGQEVPAEVLAYWGNTQNPLDDRSNWYEPDEAGSNESEGPPYEPGENLATWGGVDPFDSGKSDQGNNDEDFEDGDEWKRLLK